MGKKKKTDMLQGMLDLLISGAVEIMLRNA